MTIWFQVGDYREGPLLKLTAETLHKKVKTGFIYSESFPFKNQYHKNYR